MEDVIALKLNTRFLLEIISVASKAILFTINTLRKFISVSFFSALSVKTRQTLLLICETATEMTALMNLVAWFSHKLNAIFLATHVIKCRQETKCSLRDLLITEAANWVAHFFRLHTCALSGLMALLSLNGLLSNSKSWQNFLGSSHWNKIHDNHAFVVKVWKLKLRDLVLFVYLFLLLLNFCEFFTLAERLVSALLKCRLLSISSQVHGSASILTI